MDKLEALKALIELIACFNRHRWFKDKDMEDLMPFISGTLMTHGVYVMPCGCAWAHETTKEQVEEYLSENKTLFDSYHSWASTQR